jgi:hypothetical protein
MVHPDRRGDGVSGCGCGCGATDPDQCLHALGAIQEPEPGCIATPDEAGDPTVSFAEFVARRDEAQAEPLIACEQGAALPAGGLAILAATIGHGKTTWTVELILHACAGRDYLGLRFPRPLRVLVIENEGPREAFRAKLEQRLTTWEHGGAPRIWDEPASWGQIRISDPATRARIRAAAEQHQTDLIMSDSLTRFGVRGNGTPEETREFVEWLSQVGLGRDVAFLLLHHPRTRPDPGESEVERLAGAWPPHADLILLLTRLEHGRARLSYPKLRWARAPRPAAILAFDAETESFSYLGDDVPVERDLVAELVELMSAGDWWTLDKLRKPKDKNGVGAGHDSVAEALHDERFENAKGDTIGKRHDATYYRLREPSRSHENGRDGYPPGPPKADEPSPVLSRKGGDGSEDG